MQEVMKNLNANMNNMVYTIPKYQNAGFIWHEKKVLVVLSV